MCLGIPYEVAEVLDAENCVVRVGDQVRHCFTGAVGDVRAGDWLIVHAGLAVEKVSEEEARENLELIQTYIFGP